MTSLVRGLRRTAAALALLVAALPCRARAEAPPTAAMDGRWHFVVAPYMWATGLSGELSVGNQPRVPIDASFSDLLGDLDIAVQGHVEGRKDRFGFGLDAMWVNLGVPVESDAPVVGRLGLEVDARTTLAEGLVFYRVASGGRENNPAYLDLLAGTRYSDSRNRLTATTAAGIDYEGAFQDLDWWDPLGGVRFHVPLGSRAGLLGRADVAGVGSELTWNLEGDLAFRLSRHWAAGAGWRHLDVDHEEAEDGARKLLDLVYDGPRAWFSYSW